MGLCMRITLGRNVKNQATPRELTQSKVLMNSAKRLEKQKRDRIPVAGLAQQLAKDWEGLECKGEPDRLKLGLDLVKHVALVLCSFFTDNQLFSFLSQVLFVDVVD
jgi:hypothetical protein